MQAGCGAVGCATLKLLALMGFGTGPLSFAEVGNATCCTIKQVNNSSRDRSSSDWFFDGVSFPSRTHTRGLRAIVEALSRRIMEHAETPDNATSSHQPSRFGDTDQRARAGLLHSTSDSRSGSSSPDGVSPVSHPVDVNAFGESATAISDSEAPTISTLLHGFRDVSVSETTVFETRESAIPLNALHNGKSQGSLLYCYY
ncbi:unnamed protein product [Dibothriocephalus latus]|uniref:Uncharacterized protein n=1 Tax=Dibothriocephalus latus TaxID=60516 RepID=A0A3P7L7U3_DIBLA|nr:unnamed protein product [Dibothriocephalus latus]